MKKLGIVLLVLVFSQCQVKIEPRTANAETPIYFLNRINASSGGVDLEVSVYNREGIEYRIFTVAGYHGGGVAVVNHTKEKLEVELLRAQLLELKKVKNGN